MKKKFKIDRSITIILVVIFLGVVQGLTNNYYISIGCLLVLLLGFPLVRLIKEKDQLMVMIRYVEGNMFGKPLDKGLWKPGEKKNVKTKVVWRKRKNEKRK